MAKRPNRRSTLTEAPAPGRPGIPGRAFGAHQSIAGGLVLAVERAVETGCECLQIFTRNINRWDTKPIDPSDAAAFREAVRKAGLDPVVAHDSYLINPASATASLRERSIAGLVEELERAECLGIRWVVAHPGSGCGGDVGEAVRLAASGIREALRRTAGLKAGVLVETTAGQGSCLGASFEEIGAILRVAEGDGDDAGFGRSRRRGRAGRRARGPDGFTSGRIGVCLDTCHVFAAGYPLHPLEALDQTLDTFDREVGLERLVLIHCNDSKRERGSRVDRHEAIGAGHIGLDAFRLLVNHPRLAGIPMILETPKEDADGRPTPAADRRNLSRLRRLVTGTAPRRAAGTRPARAKRSVPPPAAGRARRESSARGGR